jgi:hypothetical protein
MTTTTTRKEILEELILEFKGKVEPFIDIYEILPKEYDICDIVFYISSVFNNKRDFKDTINDLFELRDIKTKDDVRVKELLHDFVVEFFKIN